MNNMKSRSFTILVDSLSPEGKLENGGRFLGTSPMQAAKKAFTQITRNLSKGKECKYIFSIQETTHGSKKRQFTYCGTKTRLSKPTEISKNGNSYKIDFKTDVKSFRETKTDRKKKTEKPKTSSKQIEIPAISKFRVIKKKIVPSLPISS